MKPWFFISDAHLGHTNDPETVRRKTELFRFFDLVGHEAKGLVIVGDLFDFWFEYRSVIPRRHFDVLCGLTKLVNTGVRVMIISGNHDFWLDTFFTEDLGIPVHPDFTILEESDCRIYIAHGDGLAKKDKGYRLLKRTIRNPLSIRLYRLLHPDAGFGLASFFSRMSRQHNLIKDDDSDYLTFARDRFFEGYDGVVLGHTHRPVEHRENGKTYINLGDWMNHFTYGKLVQGRLSLEHWIERGSSCAGFV